MQRSPFVVAVFVAFSVLCAFASAACSDDDTGTSSGSSGTSGASSGGSSGSSGTSGSATDGGSGGADSSSGATGGGALGTGNGVTGTIDGVVKTHTFTAQRVPQQTSTALVEAFSAQFPPYDQWRVRFLPNVGTQACTAGVGPDDVSIQFNSVAAPNSGATTGNPQSSCSITVTSLSPKLEGSFTATMQTSTGTVTVTDGYFRVNN